MSQSIRKGRTRGPSPDKTAKTRALIIQAALTSFLDRGFAQTSMADIASEAQVAKGTPYRYFDTKEELFQGVIQDVVVDALGDLSAVAPGDESVEVFLRRTLLPVMRDFETSKRAAVARLVISEGKAFPGLIEFYTRRVYEPMLDLIRRSAQVAVKRGELADDTLARYPHLLIAPIWVSLINNALLSPDRPVDVGELFEAQLDVLFPAKQRPAS